MAEYIDREALIAEYDRVHQGPAGGARKLMVDAPAADVVAVRHGEWLHDPPYTSLSGEYLKASECSNCYALFVSNGNEPYSDHPYCCRCGSKMDGERNKSNE